MDIDLSKVIGYSRDSLQSRALMRSIMLDLYPGKTREMNVLLDVYESGVPRKIKNDGNITENELVKEGYHLVDFYAEWCGPCKMMGPVLESIEDKIDIIKIDVDKFPDLAQEYRVMSIPDLMIFKDGEKILESVGFQSKEDLEEVISNL